jgi:hypothetical protein
VLALLDHAERVDVVGAPRSMRARQAVRAEVDALLEQHPGAWYGVGDGVSTVSVRLAGSAVELATLLHDRFADAVEIDIAGFSFPLDPRAPRRPLRGGVIATADIPGVQVSVDLETDHVTSGGLFRGLVSLHNISSQRLILSTDSSLSGVLLDSEGQALAMYLGATAGTGRGITLSPGDRTSIPFHAGMDSLDPSIGTVLPPGDYDLIVPVPVGYGETPAQLVSPSIRVTVLPRPRHSDQLDRLWNQDDQHPQSGVLLALVWALLR